MAINVAEEDLITFTELAKALPCRRAGRPVHVSTIHRWRSRGIKGLRLEAVRVGGAWHTSWAAFARFSAELTVLAEKSDVVMPRRSAKQAVNKAGQQLERDGW